MYIECWKTENLHTFINKLISVPNCFDVFCHQNHKFNLFSLSNNSLKPICLLFTTCNFLKNHFLHFLITVDILYWHIVLVSGEHPSDWALQNLLSDHPDKSNTHLTPHTVITILLTVFPMLYFTTCDCSVTTLFYFLIPSPFWPISPTLTPIWQPSKCSLFYKSVSVLLVYFDFWIQLLIDLYLLSFYCPYF